MTTDNNNNNAYFDRVHENNLTACNYFWEQLSFLQDYQAMKRLKDCRFPLNDSLTGAITISPIGSGAFIKITLTSHNGISWISPQTDIHTPAIDICKGSPFWEAEDGLHWHLQSPFSAAHDLSHALTIHNADDRIDGIHQHTDKFLLWQYTDAFQIIQAGALFETVYQNVSEGGLMNINDFTRRYYYNIGLALRHIYGI
nr:MAG TPA: hypothetical protein [Caudoviricetes sp.]